MAELFKSEYLNKAETYIVPLTGLRKQNKFEMNAYLFWNEYSIEDYKLILLYSYDNEDEFMDFYKESVFPILDKKATVEASFDIPASSQTKKRTIFVLDMSEWAKDIEMVLHGKYSNLGFQAKDIIKRYHIFEDEWTPLHIYVTLFPTEKLSLLKSGDKDKMSALEYAAEQYGWDLETLEEIGEIGSKYTKEHETLLVGIDDVCQKDIISVKGI